MMLDDYVVPNKELRVTMSMVFDSQDLSSQTSGTDTAHKGIKPKVFNVSLVLPFTESDSLTELVTIAQAVTAKGALKIYDITDDTANALKVRQVKFTDSFNVREAGNLKAWTIQFALMEYLSVPEKAEQRQETDKPQAQSADGATVSPTDDDDKQPKTFFERQLFKIETALS